LQAAVLNVLKYIERLYGTYWRQIAYVL